MITPAGVAENCEVGPVAQRAACGPVFAAVGKYRDVADPGRRYAERQAWARPGEDAADVISDLLAEPGLPQTLRAVGPAPGLLDTIAGNALLDRLIHSNSLRIDGPATVRKLLDAAWSNGRQMNTSTQHAGKETVPVSRQCAGSRAKIR